jgi:hypothetical protein
MSGLGSFSSEMIGLNHLVIYLSDGGGVASIAAAAAM